METEMVSAERAEQIAANAEEALDEDMETDSWSNTTVRDLARTVIALHEILDGRTTPPTDEELDVHAQRSPGGAGVWLIVIARGPVIDVVTLPESRAWHMERGAARWTPMLDGRPCAWPEVSR